MCAFLLKKKKEKNFLLIMLGSWSEIGKLVSLTQSKVELAVALIPVAELWNENTRSLIDFSLLFSLTYTATALTYLISSEVKLSGSLVMNLIRFSSSLALPCVTFSPLPTLVPQDQITSLEDLKTAYLWSHEIVRPWDFKTRNADHRVVEISFHFPASPPASIYLSKFLCKKMTWKNCLHFWGSYIL